MPEIPSGNKIARSTRRFNEEQRRRHNWSMNFIKGFSTKKSFTVDPIRIFLSGSGGTEKRHLMKTLYQAVSKELLYHAKYPEKVCVFWGPRVKSAVIIAGITIYSGLGVNQAPKLLGFSDYMKASLRNRLSEVLILTDELSMASSDLFYHVHTKLIEIFLCIVSIAFFGLSVVLLGDFLKLPPVRGKPMYACVDEHDKLERLLG